MLFDYLGAKFKDTHNLCKNGGYHCIIFNAGAILCLIIVVGVNLVFLVD